jgi:DNA-binding NtrC family response regulator
MPEEHATALIASPSSDFRRRVLEVLSSAQWTAIEAVGGAEALARIETGSARLLLLDRHVLDLDVSELMFIIKSRHPDVEVVLLDSEERRVISQPPDEPRISHVVDLLQRMSESHGNGAGHAFTVNVEEPAPEPIGVCEEPLPGMIGTSPAMQQIYRLARLVAPRSTTVLITGETGTGKELVARAIHQLSPRSHQPFITVNCAAIPEPLLEAELFGHARGAFTGAFQSRLGRIQSAHGGTLFLDEVGDLPLAIQAKLLRFMQEGEVQRLGSSDVIRVDVRVVAATNAELEQRVGEGKFREDLYYRVSVFPITLAPLRSRPEDILTLSRQFLDEICREALVPSKGISRDAARALQAHRWPGNVRELRHVVERAFILAGDGPELLPEHISPKPLWRSGPPA